jgi:hypothetical protein
MRKHPFSQVSPRAVDAMYWLSIALMITVVAMTGALVG